MGCLLRSGRRAQVFVRLSHVVRRGRHTNVVNELEARGFVAALTSPKIRAHTDTPTTIYAGVDPSASSLHVGNLLPLLGLLHFASRGHRSIALIGGATGSIGDPSGRSTERVSLDSAELDRNVKGITAQVERFFERGMEYAERRGYGRGLSPSSSSSLSPLSSTSLASSSASASPSSSALASSTISSQISSSSSPTALSSSSPTPVQVLNNLDWTSGLGLLEFLRTVGKVARVNVMLARDSVKNRLNSDSGISYTEFSYQLLQAYDFHVLHRDHACRIQLGGSDQWGNIVAGIDLIKSLAKQGTSGSQPPNPLQASQSSLVTSSDSIMADDQEGPEAYGLTIPLLTTSSGEKFGKSAGNAVWLDEGRTSVSEFYQFFLRAADEDVERYLKIFTLLPLATINDILHEHKGARSKREAQKLLAEEVTELVHGRDGVSRAQATTQLLFTTQIRQLKSQDVLNAFEGDSRLKRVQWKDVKDVPVSKLAVAYGLLKSRADANRLIRSKSFQLNDRTINDPRSFISRTDIIDKHLAIIRVGKSHLIFYIDGLV